MRQPPTLLVVDDQVDNQRLLVNLLKPDYRVLVASDGEMALLSLQTGQRPDLILLDVMMPGMDGYEVCRRIKTQFDLASIPIIFLTARVDAESETQGLTLGAVDYVTKPINPPVLRARIAAQLALAEKIRRANLERDISHRIVAKVSRERDEIENLVRSLEDQIAKRALAEAQLRIVSEAVTQAPISIVITDAAGTIVYVNPHFSYLTGYAPEEVIGQNPRLLKSGEMDEHLYQTMWATLSAGNIWRGELLNKGKQGQLFWESVAISPVRNTDGIITHYVGIKEDIGDRKELERVKEDVERIMRHDLKSPLLRAALRNAGLIPGENLTIVPHSFDASPLIRSEIDAMTAFVTNDPFDLESKGVGFQILELGGYLPGLGDGYLFTSEAQARDQPEVTRAFVEASNAGWRYALAHSDELIDLIRAHYAPQRSHTALRYEATRTRELMQTPLLPVGALAPARIELAAAAMLEIGTLGEARHLDNFVFQASAAQATPAADPEWTDAERDWLATHDQIVLGISTQFEPGVIVAEDGSVSGVIVDYIALLNEQLGDRIKLHIEADWESVAQKAITREIDGLALSAPNPTWDQHFAYTDPYYHAYFYVFQRTDVPIMRLPHDLAGQRIGYLRGFKRLEHLLASVPDAELIAFDTHSHMINALLADQITAFLASDELEWRQQQHGLRHFRLAGVLEDSRYPIVASIRNDWPLAVGIFNRALNRIPADCAALARQIESYRFLEASAVLKNLSHHNQNQ